MDQVTVGDAVREVLPSQRDAEFVLMSLRPDDTLAIALRKLQGLKISGAPVLEDHSARSLRSARMVDLMDLALAIVESAGRPEVFNTSVRLIAGSAKEGGAAGLPFIYNDAPFVEGVRALKQSRARRLLVLDQATDAPLALLSQSSVVSWALRHIKHLPADLMAKPVSQLECGSRVVTVKRDEPMPDALRRFVGEDKSGVAVVDDRGRVVANLSLADLRCLTPENAAELLRLNVGAFLSATQELPKDPVTCRPSATLTEALHLLHSHRVHRALPSSHHLPPPRSPHISDRGHTRVVCGRGRLQVYVTDEQGLPVGVFSTTDAVANLCP